MDPRTLLRVLNASAMALMGLFVAFALVYGRMTAIFRRGQVSEPPRSLTASEREVLRQWQRRTISWFVFTIGVVVVFGFSQLLVRPFPSSVYLAAYIAVLGIAITGLAIHFAGRCPLCGRRIGFQSTLLLPMACEICGAVFRPDAALAPLLALDPVGSAHVISKTRILGWPLFAVAFGRDPATGRSRGVARAVVAVGDVAIGIVAVGGFAVGAFPVGGISIGILSVGGVAIGLSAVGGLAVGGLALGGLAVGVYALGGIAMGLHALGSLAVDPGTSTMPWLNGRPR